MQQEEKAAKLEIKFKVIESQRDRSCNVFFFIIAKSKLRAAGQLNFDLLMCNSVDCLAKLCERRCGDVQIEIIFHNFRHRVAIKNHKSFPQSIFMSVNKKMLTVNKLQNFQFVSNDSAFCFPSSLQICSNMHHNKCQYQTCSNFHQSCVILSKSRRVT